MRSSPLPRDQQVSELFALTDLLEVSDLLLASGKVRLRIASRSMVPTLRPGDEIAVEPISIDALRAGDLILFEHQGALLCHRLIQISGMPPTLLTRGDAASSGGQRISQDRVLGKLVAIKKRSVWLGLKETLKYACMPLLLHWLPSLQRRKAYRLLLRPCIAPFLTYHLGLAQGSRWYQWQELRNVDGVPALPSSPRAHLLIAELGRDVAGRVHLTWTGAGWHTEALSVRIRYRGFGIESDLACLAYLLVHAQH